MQFYLLNGKPLRKFYPERGLRQGDPLSPYLFLLCNEVFSRFLYHEQQKGNLHGIRVARNSPEISHLMFADDTIVFLGANPSKAETLVRCIKKFEDWSGQVCSKPKSGLLISNNCNPGLKENLWRILGVGNVKNTDQHLGNPFLFGRSKRSDFNFIKTKLCDRLEGWRLKHLSKVGRMTFIKSVALSIPSYTMSTFKLPSLSCNELDSIVRRFWWTGSIDSKHFLATKSWNALCQPKQRGGLGFRRFEDINQSLLSKLAWQLATNDNRPWCQVMKAKYFPRESFWSVSEKITDSFVWRSILKARLGVAEGACSIIVSGECIDIWWQPWIPWLGYNDFRTTMEKVREIAPYLVCVADLMYRNTKRWNHGFLRFLFGDELGAKIGAIQIVKNGKEDFLVWKSSTSGCFSVKGAYWMAQSGRFNETNRFWSWIWNANIHPRLSLMLWRTCANVLPTANTLNPNNCKCFFCDSGDENPLHLFATCPFALALWFSCPFPVRLDTIHFGSISELLCNLCEGADIEKRSQMLVCYAVLFETIWNVRNKILHNVNASWSVDQARRDIVNRFNEFVTSHSSPSLSITASGTEEVSLNIHSKNLVVVDGSFSNGLFGCAAIIIDRDSLEWSCSSAAGSYANALVAEMEAITLGMKWALRNGWDEFTIASDSEILVDAIRTRRLPNWQSPEEFYSLLQLFDSSSFVNVVFVKRNVITYVDELAKNARHSQSGSLNCKGEGFLPVNPAFFWC
ncbi:uncharacterized protein LOC133033879 [Cannabis sativa]|uniref:uncharacterized protein LOC133033879 n=1 Tax=Cannabis sativa TaxID=3483 RepID=UPI0029CA583B|nr:uncharacterized protein LOC133033879 [Cannabis sativa]